MLVLEYVLHAQIALPVRPSQVIESDFAGLSSPHPHSHPTVPSDRNTDGSKCSVSGVYSEMKCNLSIKFYISIFDLIEPNQALQRTEWLVTDHAPSSTLRAKHVHR